MRQISFREDPGSLAMGIDEALLESRMNGGESTFRLYRFNPSCVTLGYFQGYKDEIFHESRVEQGIDAVRRITGGGAVFHDFNGEITYSVVATRKEVGAVVVDSYNKICQGLVNALGELGLEGKFSPINDVLIGEKKVSGSAQTRRGEYVLQHGTFMYSTDIEQLFSVLNVSKTKIADKMLASIKDRVITVEQALEREVDMDEIITAMEKGFGDVFGDFEKSDLGEDELKRATQLAQEKYGTDEWLNKR